MKALAKHALRPPCGRRQALLGARITVVVGGCNRNGRGHRRAPSKPKQTRPRIEYVDTLKQQNGLSFQNAIDVRTFDKEFDIPLAVLYSAELLAWRGTQAVNGSRL